MTIPLNLIDYKNLPIVKTKESNLIFLHGYREVTRITDNSYECIHLYDDNYDYIEKNLVGGFDRLPDLVWSYSDVYGNIKKITTLQWIAIDLQGNYCVLRSIYYHGLYETQRDYRAKIVQEALKQVFISKTKQELIQEHITDYL